VRLFCISRIYFPKFWVLFLAQQSLQKIGLSGDGWKGSSVISFPHSEQAQFPLIISLGGKFPLELSLNLLNITNG
jgi:hypothetical protein